MQALIVGAGPGISASFARLLAREGCDLALAARNIEKLGALAAEMRATTHACDVADPAQVAALFAAIPAPDVVLFNASQRVRGGIVELDPGAVSRAIAVSAFGGFLVGQQAARVMLERGSGTILFTGASASVKGYPLSSAFAMGKFALRGLAQSMARELHPKNVHVVHLIIDGRVRSATHKTPPDAPDSLLDPDAIAASMLALVRQPRTAWTDELPLRPWVESF